MPIGPDSIVDLGNLPIGGNYSIRVTVTTIVSSVPAGITYNAFNAVGDVGAVTDNSPITLATAPTGVPTVIGEAELVNGPAADYAAQIKVESQCSDHEITFLYIITP
jgi:hypothetical protein